MPRLSFNRNVLPSCATAQYSPSRTNENGADDDDDDDDAAAAAVPSSASLASASLTRPVIPSSPAVARADAISSRARVRSPDARRARPYSYSVRARYGLAFMRRQRAIASSKYGQASSHRSSAAASSPSTRAHGPSQL